MIRKITDAVIKFQREYLPSSYFIAIILTIIVFICSVVFTDKSVMDVVGLLGNGYFGLLAFTMQIVLMEVTGHALANSPIVLKFLRKICRIPKTKTQAVMFTAFVSYIACYIHWAFGLIAGALLAKEIAKINYGKKIHYPLLVGAAYSGILARGLSSSVFLAPASAGHAAESIVGIIPITETLFCAPNIILTIILGLTIPFIFKAMIPPDDEVIEINIENIPKENVVKLKDKSKYTFAEKLNDNWIASFIIAALLSIYIVYAFAKAPTFNLSMNMIILIFLVLGMFAQKTPKGYADAMHDAVKTADGMILQFPLYAAVMVLLRDSGLSEMISNWFISISTATTLPFFSFLSAGIINFFVPSGGGLWALEGPIMLQAAKDIGANPAAVMVGIGWGDSWTTMIQPFWALPLLAIAGLDVKDIMGYCTLILVWSGILIGACLFIMA